MIRQATMADIPGISQTYADLLAHEAVCGSTTNWRAGVYPTDRVPQTKIPAGAMYVLEEDGVICGSMVLNHDQPAEYRDIDWLYPAEDAQVLVIHTLCVAPQHAGKGYGTQLVRFALAHARALNCRVVRIDTWEHNEPAKRFYAGRGFRLAGLHRCLHEGVIDEVLAYLEICVDE